MLETRNTPFEAPLEKLERARSAVARAMPHRALARMPFRAADLAAAAALALALWGALFAARPAIMEYWVACIAFWLEALRFPLGPATGAGAGRGIVSLLAPLAVDPPAPAALLCASGLTAAAWVLSGRLQGKHLPIKYLLRCLCALMLLSILVFLLLPASLPYSQGEHADDLLTNGYRCLLVFPFILGLGYYLFRERLAVKLFYSLAIVLYFLLMIPHKVVLHVVLLHVGSRLAMPLLYVCLGSAFDIVVFVALYAWALSNLPPQQASA